MEIGVFAHGRRCDGPGNAIRQAIQLSSILLMSNFDVSWPIADAAGDDVPSVPKQVVSMPTVRLERFDVWSVRLHTFLGIIRA